MRKSLEIQQTDLHLENKRHINLYFPAVSFDGQLQSACLEMEFAALAYFEVKLAYASPNNNTYKEQLMFRSVQSLGEEVRHWRTTITRDMTEGQAFVVVLHSQSFSLGTMVTIDSIKLLMQACNTTGTVYKTLVILPVQSPPLLRSPLIFPLLTPTIFPFTLLRLHSPSAPTPFPTQNFCA